MQVKKTIPILKPTNRLFNRYNKTNILFETVIEKNGKLDNKFVLSSASKATTWKAAEVLIPYLLKINTEESREIVLNFLTREKIEGTKPYIENNSKYSDTCYYGEDMNPVIAYLKGVAEYNSRCHYVLDMAILYNNRALARRIVPLIKEEFKYEDRRQYSDPNVYVNGINRQRIDEAKKKLREAGF